MVKQTKISMNATATAPTTDEAVLVARVNPVRRDFKTSLELFSRMISPGIHGECIFPRIDPEPAPGLYAWGSKRNTATRPENTLDSGDSSSPPV